ncbi:unnamed protein product [Ranitomeya imitator]|uniref:Uncharacterized protein n=1 Tax=Ranitomeya imitator TaxID=111125 RepID=A0ABN9MNG2_9NEOB|nr:unnamed protein product [Ranitomeya imitator]
MEATEDPVEGKDMTGGDMTENERNQKLLDIEARQQILLENTAVCNNILVQLHRLQKTLVEKENAESACESSHQSKS